MGTRTHEPNLRLQRAPEYGTNHDQMFAVGLQFAAIAHHGAAQAHGNGRSYFHAQVSVAHQHQGRVELLAHLSDRCGVQLGMVIFEQGMLNREHEIDTR